MSRPIPPPTTPALPVVWIARHGETSWNCEGRIQGHHDVPLNERGVEQARALAERFRRSPPARIVSSDLLRAMQTAQIISAACGVPITTEPGFREQHLGDWQGITFDEARRRDPDLARRFAARDPDVRPPGDGAETRAEVSERRWAAFHRHATQGSASPLLVVAHGGVVQALVYRVFGLAVSAPRRLLVPNASVTTLTAKGDVWYVRTMSDDSHLVSTPGESFPFE
jgi:2,3-bisphosphoglycerate-dependent phosphoglycerate mutase